MKLVVSVFWICCTAEKRDQMSPMWRFSNHSTGRRIRCANTLASHCRLSVADSTSTAQERIAAVPAWISTSSPKPMPSVASRSRSALTSTSSTTHCIRKGLSSMKASSASASAKICASERFSPLTRPEHLARRDMLLLDARHEVGRRRQLQHHAGEVARHLLQLQPPQAVRRVVDRRHAAAHADQHHEVVHVPVQDAGELQLRQVLDLGAQRARMQLHALGHAHQVEQVHALQRQRKALAQRRQVGAVAVRRGHHRQAGQAAFGAFGLQDHRHAAGAEAQPQPAPVAEAAVHAQHGGSANGHRAPARTAIRSGAAARAARRPPCACRPPAAAWCRRRSARRVHRHGDAEHRLGRAVGRQPGRTAADRPVRAPPAACATPAAHGRSGGRTSGTGRLRSAAAPPAAAARSRPRPTARTDAPAAAPRPASGWPGPRPATRSGQARPAPN